ncbi:hypothetical protein HHK36_003704 [Tetracentron sinense]|uniref:DUF1771 domain-containing protein n=1 Tax=Tetracentron sinense TaxID=13715 RepID=A0A834ZPS5_TETSI|nr:hypothetical protein HHK36_003704 [Tetracentron sinense]
MEPSSSRSSEYDGDERDLEVLLDAFGSVLSLRDIASAYCKAGRNAELTGEILYELQGSVSNTVSHASNVKSSNFSFDKIYEKSTKANEGARASKTKKYSVSMGTVSGVLGKGYVRPTPLANESSKATKPLKLDSKDLPVSELWEKESSADFVARNDTMQKDVEDFMFQMLGEGFQLDRGTIREVLDEEDSYEVLRRSAKENWVTMKEYYKASADAFAKGDRAQSYKLLEQGHFFNKKAREADEKSAQKILEIRNKETRDEMPLDLHDHGTKEALRLLKFHLTSISGISSMPYLKVILETNDEDVTKGARRRLDMRTMKFTFVTCVVGSFPTRIQARKSDQHRRGYVERSNLSENELIIFE